VQTCETAECRQAAVLQAWAADPEEGLALLLALPDEVERTATAVQVLEVHPKEVGPLCGRLPQGATLERCIRVSRRPHLNPPKEERGKRPLFFDQLEDVDQNHAPGEVTPDLGSCGSSQDLISCLREAALAKAQVGDVRAAAALCAAIPLTSNPPERWRSDCFFNAAERLVEIQGHNHYAQAVGLCHEAKKYFAPCVTHLLMSMARVVPAADEKGAQEWVAAREAASAIAAYWAGTSLAERLVDGFWALATGMAMHSAPEVSGDLLEHVPPEAVPHVRAAAAARMLAIGRSKESTLKGWSNAVSAALKLRKNQELRRSRHRRYRVADAQWPRRVGEKDGMKIIFYNGPAVRVVAEDPGIDMTICVLEAAARLDPVPTELLRDGLAHRDRRVRWTAEQLLLKTR